MTEFLEKKKLFMSFKNGRKKFKVLSESQTSRLKNPLEEQNPTNE